jgi:3',5'-cyclic AMP phosphodiesterase CpdA
MLIAQLSDLHVRPEGMLYQGVADSNAQLAAAIAHLNGLAPRPDLVLLTGDLVETGAAAEYAKLRALLAALAIPALVIPGNHDDREAFRAAFRDHDYLPGSGPMHYAAERGGVRIVAFDVTVPGRHHGLVDEEGAGWLDATLAAQPDTPTLVMMHQPPFDTAVPYLDLYSCREGGRLAAVIQRHRQIERIVCGHVHRFMTLRFGGTLLCTAPSTTTAIALRLDPKAEPASHLEPPAFLLHHWRRETGIVTHFLPVGTFPGPWPFA